MRSIRSRHVIFYMSRRDGIDVIGVLHGTTNIDALRRQDR
jgi:predicted PilT family ATPase